MLETLKVSKVSPLNFRGDTIDTLPVSVSNHFPSPSLLAPVWCVQTLAYYGSQLAKGVKLREALPHTSKEDPHQMGCEWFPWR